MGFVENKYRSIKKVLPLRNISKGFSLFIKYIGLGFTVHVIKFSCNFVSKNHIKVYEY